MFLVGCASINKNQSEILYNFMPEKSFVMDSLLIPIANFKDSLKYDDFKSISINSGTGMICDNDSCSKEKSIKLPAGILISDRTAVELTNNRIGINDANRRFIIAKELFNNYEKNVKVAEKLYDNRIQDLEKQAKRSWLERNIQYFGVLGGIAITLLTEFAVIKISK